jgi:hypothetical protein
MAPNTRQRPVLTLWRQIHDKDEEIERYFVKEVAVEVTQGIRNYSS